MARRIAEAEPPVLLNPIVGAAYRIIADRGPVMLYLRNRRLKKAITSWWQLDQDRCWLAEVKTCVCRNKEQSEQFIQSRLSPALFDAGRSV